MVAIVTSFESTDLYVADQKSFEEFVVFELNPSVCGDIESALSLHEDEKDDPSLGPANRGGTSKDQIRNVRLWQNQRRKKRLWERRRELPVCLVTGRNAGTVALRASGDSDNGDDTNFSDREIQRICRFLPSEGTFGFHYCQMPSNDTDEPGRVCYWVYDHGTVVARASRDWTLQEITSGKLCAPSLREFMRHYRRTRSLRLVVREV